MGRYVDTGNKTRWLASVALSCLINIAGLSQERSIPELVKLITNHQYPNNPLIEGSYTRGSWQQVKDARMPKTMYWSYPVGVVLLGMQRGFEVTHDSGTMQYVTKNIRISADSFTWMAWQFSRFGKINSYPDLEKLLRFKLTGSGMLDDYGAMGAAILETKLYHHAGLTDNLSGLLDTIGYLITIKQDRLPDRSFWRPNSPDGPTIWADDLYMCVPFLVRWSQYKNEPSSLDDAATQIINYAGYLQDTDGVWFHAYFVNGEKKGHSCCKWGRANGWVAVAIAELLSVLPRDHPKYLQVLDICKRQIDGLINYQSPSGLWYQVIDHPELKWGTETSCSAQFTYAIARGINKGWLDSSYSKIVRKSLHALIDTSRISPAGDILKVCSSTSIGNDLGYYESRKIEIDDQKDRHGSGAMLLALAEMHQLLRHSFTGGTIR